MRRRILSGLALAAVATAFTGCTGSSYRPTSWNPFAWTSQPSSSNQYNGYAKDLSKSPAEANQSWASKTWQSTTETLSAPFQSKTIKQDPLALATPSQSSPQLHLATGQMMEAKGDNAEAVVQYEKALALSPNDLNARVSLARLYDRQGDVPRAVSNYQQAAAAHPNSGLVHNDLGLCYARHRQIPQSVGELETAIRIDPANQMYRNNLATVLIESNREDEAFEHLAAVNPPAIAHYNFGYLLHQRGRDDSAARELQTALSMDGSLGSASALLAQIQPSGTVANQRGIPAIPASYPNYNTGNPATYQR